MSHRGQNRGHLAWLMVSGHAYDCNTPPLQIVRAHITYGRTGALSCRSAR
jgi:hypothetical protein